MCGAGSPTRPAARRAAVLPLTATSGAPLSNRACSGAAHRLTGSETRSHTIKTQSQTLADGSQPGLQQLPHLGPFHLAAHGVHHNKAGADAAAAKSYPVRDVYLAGDWLGGNF